MRTENCLKKFNATKYIIDTLLCYLNELEPVENLSGISKHGAFTKTRSDKGKTSKSRVTLVRRRGQESKVVHCFSFSATS